MHESSITIVQDVDRAIEVLHDVATWLETSGKHPNKWWQPQNMNREFMLQQAEPNEFYVALIDNTPAAAIILQDNQRNQDWHYIDKGSEVKALYLHWLAVARKFAGQDLPKVMITFAAKHAKRNNLPLLRLDTNAKEEKLTDMYKKLGFQLMGIEKEDYREAAFFQKELK